ncbi:MAG: GPP34 family phosphoprotein [Actinomycetota bacterium]|nr:GPP34 family phosphoprotein [Actinomycetota bacterium]
MAQDKLAESMFLLLHDPFSGRPEVAPELLNCALVAAELAELIIAGRVGIDNDRVVLIDGGDVGSDEMSAFVLESIRSQPRTHSVRSWVEVLSDVLYEMVAGELVEGGVVSREQGGRRLLRRGADRFPSVDLLRASAPRVGLEHMLRVPDDLDLQGAVIAAILGALDIVQGFDVGIDRVALRGRIAELTQQLPSDLRDIVAGVEASAASISLTVRR